MGFEKVIQYGIQTYAGMKTGFHAGSSLETGFHANSALETGFHAGIDQNAG